MRGAQAGWGAGRVRVLAGASRLLPFRSLSNTPKVPADLPHLPQNQIYRETPRRAGEKEMRKGGNLRAEGPQPGRAGAEAWRQEVCAGDQAGERQGPEQVAPRWASLRSAWHVKNTRVCWNRADNPEIDPHANGSVGKEEGSSRERALDQLDVQVQKQNETKPGFSL